jgi:hypothetical protein
VTGHLLLKFSLVERILGKDEEVGSMPIGSSEMVEETLSNVSQHVRKLGSGSVILKARGAPFKRRGAGSIPARPTKPV